MKLIKLTKGYYCKVDDEDYEYLNQWNWRYDKHSGATRRKYINKVNGKWVFEDLIIPRLLMSVPVGFVVDHKNMNNLDDRKKNLRICTVSQNNCNKEKASRNKSGYKGVLWCKWHKKWRSVIMFNGKASYLGYFVDKKDAAIAYNTAAKYLHGKFARLNKI